MDIVVDANVAIEWFRLKPHPFAEAVLETLQDHDVIVPELWCWEVQDVLRRLDASGQLTKPADDVMNELLQLPISVDDRRVGLFGDETPLSRKYALSVYDAAYLDVALRHRIELATLDKRLAAAARRAGAAFTLSGPET
jgi:predicted nucleic acid-binding protein